MNFWKYTFTGRFAYYAAIACVVATVVMLTSYMLGNTQLAWIIFFALTTLLKVGITGSYMRWKSYSKHRSRKIGYWGNRTRLN